MIMCDTPPDFYLGSCDIYGYERPRSCWRLARLRGWRKRFWPLPWFHRRDFLAIRVSPSIDVDPKADAVGNDGSGASIAVVTNRFVGDGLFPIREWPMYVHLFLPRRGFDLDSGVATKDHFYHAAWCELYQTAEDASRACDILSRVMTDDGDLKDIQYYWRTQDGREDSYRIPDDEDLAARGTDRDGHIEGVTAIDLRTPTEIAEDKQFWAALDAAKTPAEACALSEADQNRRRVDRELRNTEAQIRVTVRAVELMPRSRQREDVIRRLASLLQGRDGLVNELREFEDRSSDSS
jgi:hypothetical protein